MYKIKVAVIGTVGKSVSIDPDATNGAILGSNLFLPTGDVGTPESVRNWLGLGSGSTLEHRDLQGLRTGDDHPQYTGWQQNERVTGQWRWTKSLWGPDGTAALPAFTFTSDVDLGMYRVGANNLGFSTNGVLRLDVDASRIAAALPVQGVSGALGSGTLAYSFTADPDTGFYNQAADEIDVACGGTLIARFRIGGTTRSLEVGDGTNSANLIFNAAAGVVRDFFFQSAGSNRWGFRVNATAEAGSNAGSDLEFLRRTDAGGALGTAVRIMRSSGQWLFENGAVGAPELSFQNSTTTGIYRVGADILGISAAGVLQYEVGSGYSDTKAQRRLTGTITPTQLTANTNDWAPTSLATASVIRASTDASRDLTGLTGGVAGREIFLINVGSFPLVLKAESASSTAANRFALASATDSTIAAGGSVHLWYDGTSSRWRQLNRMA